MGGNSGGRKASVTYTHSIRCRPCRMSPYTAIHAVAVANPEKLFQIWCRVDELERSGSFSAATAEERIRSMAIEQPSRC